MGYLYRPMLKGREFGYEPTQEDLAVRRGVNGNGEASGEDDTGCHHPDHGKAVRESTETEKETEARRFLKDSEGRMATGQPVILRVERILYEEAAADHRTHYRTTGERDFVESETRLKHLDAFFQARRISAIGGADIARYIAARQAGGAANGTINRELGVLGF